MRWTIRMSGAVLIALFLSALLAPLISSAPYDQVDLNQRLLSPCRAHWLGTDELGRDILSRLLFGGRVSLLVSLVVVSISVVVGVSLGALCGLFGGWTDEMIMRLGDILLAFPGILLAIGLMAILGPSLQNVVFALVAMGWVSQARLARGLTLRVRELDF